MADQGVETDRMEWSPVVSGEGRVWDTWQVKGRAWPCLTCMVEADGQCGQSEWKKLSSLAEDNLVTPLVSGPFRCNFTLEILHRKRD